MKQVLFVAEFFLFQHAAASLHDYEPEYPGQFLRDFASYFSGIAGPHANVRVAEEDGKLWVISGDAGLAVGEGTMIIQEFEDYPTPIGQPAASPDLLQFDFRSIIADIKENNILRAPFGLGKKTESEPEFLRFMH